jgi:hypothetical protein
MDELLCTAMQNGLEPSETLESLELNLAPLCDENADLWCRALSFLRTNKARRPTPASGPVSVLNTIMLCPSVTGVDFGQLQH